MKVKYSLLFALIITLMIAGNFYFFSLASKQQRETAIVTRIIDGDTLVINNSTRIRLLNINTPEKTEKGYNEALVFLKELEGKTVEIERVGSDRYERELARVFTPNYLNLQLVERGLAKKFLVDQSELKEFDEAENTAVQNALGLWEKSRYFGCFNFEMDALEELVEIENTCSTIDISNFEIQDESRKKYKFPSLQLGTIKLHSSDGKDNRTDVFWQSSQSVWNNDRDTIYFFDSEHKIAYHESYGY